MRKIIMFLTVLLVYVLAIPFANAIDYTNVSTFSELKTALTNGESVKLTENIDMTAHLFSKKEVTIDLNGHTLNTKAYTIVVSNNTTTIEDSSNGEGKITGTSSFKIQIGSSSVTGSVIFNSGTLDTNSNYGIRIVNGSLTVNGGTIKAPSFTLYNQGSLTVNGGEIISNNAVAIQNHLNSTLEINGGHIEAKGDGSAINLYGDCTATINGGTIKATYYEDGISTGGVGITAYKNTNLTINDGEIISASHAISGNGSVSGNSEGTNAKFTINGGTITSQHADAIYAPQPNGETIITDGTITGDKIALEIRAGSLRVTGGIFNGSNEEHISQGNENGTTNEGAAIAVSQHNTLQPIDVYICAGTFNANIPFAETNPQGNAEEYISQITINIDEPCGKLVFNSASNQTLYSEDFTKFVKGGKYTYSISKYIADGYGERFENGMYVVYKFHNIIKNNPMFGTVATSQERGLLHDEIEITTTPDEDYNLFKLDVVDSDLNEIEVNDDKFIMPDTDVFVNAHFIKYIINEVNPKNDAKNLEIGVKDKKNVKATILKTIKNNANLYNQIKDSDPTVELVIEQKDISDDYKNKVVEKLELNDVSIIDLFNIYITVKDDNGNLVETINNVSDDIEFIINIPDDVSNIEDGYSRNYYTLEGYDEINQLTTSSINNRSISFKTSKLDNYSISYNETKKETGVLGEKTINNPPTSDKSFKLLFISIDLLLIVSVILAMKKVAKKI